ncbi:MAG: helix-turn-helix domain-containing protein [Candidatus Caldarchaeum sp.]|nr:helix-turn-helix domain-containing protein [Candidatus Caldarchaeum sp.]
MSEIDQSKRSNLMNIIAGEVVFSKRPGDVLRKWRTLFEFSQKDIAREMGIASSVLSDYEKNRRKSPGTDFVRRYVEALIRLDQKKGGMKIRQFSFDVTNLSEVVLGMAEYSSPKTMADVAKLLKGVWLAGQSQSSHPIYGYTVVNSLEAIKRLGPYDFFRLFGANTVRVVVFTNVSRGRSPIIAAKIFPIRPKMIVIHGPKSVKEVDQLAIQLAESEQMPYVLSLHEKVENILASLNSQ